MIDKTFPIAEQRRIVAEAEQGMDLVDALETQFAASRATRRQPPLRPRRRTHYLTTHEAMTAQDLFNQSDRLVSSYPIGTLKLPPGYPIAGCGFFPVVSGSFHSESLTTQVGQRKLLFVGQDWGCEDNLTALCDKNADIKSGTGKILLNLLIEAKIPLDECFFTNALFGVRKGKTNTGASPGWNDPKFVGGCAEAMKDQIAAVRPRGIVCLGRDAPKLLARLLSECVLWKTAKSFKAIDAAGCAVVSVTSFPRIDVAAILLHPSFRRANARHRSYGGSVKLEAELKILANVWSQVSSEPPS